MCKNYNLASECLNGILKQCTVFNGPCGGLENSGDATLLTQTTTAKVGHLNNSATLQVCSCQYRDFLGIFNVLMQRDIGHIARFGIDLCIRSWCIWSKNLSGCYCVIGESPFNGIKDDVLAESACNCVWQAWEQALVTSSISSSASL